MKNIVLKYVTLLSLLLLVAGCNKGNNGAIPTDKEPQLVNISMGTTATPSDNPRSYRFSLFIEDMSSEPQSGTYRDPKMTESATWLFPCAVNDDTGAITNDTKNSKFGLFASLGTYTMTAVSPAVKATLITIDSKNRWGYLINRVPEVGEAKLFIGEPVEITIEGISTNGEYNYEFPEGKNKLKEKRTKFKLEIYSKTDASYNIKSMSFTNVIDRGYYNPFVGYYVENPTKDIVPLSPFENSGAIIVNWKIAQYIKVVTSHQADEVENAIWMLAGNFDEPDRYTITPNLQIIFNGAEGDTNTNEINIGLNRDFKSQFVYTLTLVLSDTNVELHITGELDWETGGDSGDNDGEIDVLPSFKFSVSSNGDWELVNIGTEII